jgi:hypothetical protein
LAVPFSLQVSYKALRYHWNASFNCGEIDHKFLQPVIQCFTIDDYGGQGGRHSEIRKEKTILEFYFYVYIVT